MDTTVPNTHDHYDVLNLHLLQQMQQLLASAVLAGIIESLGDDFLLRNLVELAYAVGEDAVAGSGEALVRRVVHIVEVVHDELYLVLVGYGCCEGLELEFFNLLDFAVTDTLNDGEEVLPVLGEDLLGSSVGITLNILADAKCLLVLHLLLLVVLEVLVHLIRRVLHLMLNGRGHLVVQLGGVALPRRQLYSRTLDLLKPTVHALYFLDRCVVQEEVGRADYICRVDGGLRAGISGVCITARTSSIICDACRHDIGILSAVIWRCSSHVRHVVVCWGWVCHYFE